MRTKRPAQVGTIVSPNKTLLNYERGYYLEGQGDLVSRLILGIHWVTICLFLLLGLLVYLLSPPDPPSRSLEVKPYTQSSPCKG